MPKLILSGRIVELREGQTVLEALLEAGVEVPYSCRSGVCQTCKMQAIDGDIPPEAQEGLLATEKAENFFLPCVAKPTADLSLRLPTEKQRFPSELLELERVTPEILILRLKKPEGYRYHPGQFLRLYREVRQGGVQEPRRHGVPPGKAQGNRTMESQRPELTKEGLESLRQGGPKGTFRCYSLASLPEEPFLELHIKRVPGGHFSTWLLEKARSGEAIEIGGAEGSCFYLSDFADRSLLLAGTGTGLAPLYGIVRDALRQGHRGEIFLYHGAPSPQGLYLHEKLQKLARQHENFHYLGVVLEGESEGAVCGRLEEVIHKRHASLKGWCCYFCGPPNVVEPLKMKAFLAGASLKEIYSDPFLPSG